MSDFSTFNDFRKGYKMGGNNQYADPTYLSFSLVFDFNSAQKSPLLGGGAAAFYERHLSDAASGTDDVGQRTYLKGYEHRLKALNDFITTLKTINKDMPWHWQSLSGIETIQQYNDMDGYRGGNEITIETLETLNLTVAGLMHLYKTAVFDEENWKYVLPVNLRKFRVWVYVTEVRPIKNMTKIGTPLDRDVVSLDGGIGIKNSNAGISGTEHRPFFMFELGGCLLDITSGINPFADLKKTPEGFAVNQIKFMYDKVGKVEARMLNGIIEESEKTKGNISPAGDKESRSASDVKEYGTQIINDLAGNVISQAESDANIFLDKKRQQLSQGVTDTIRENTPNFENIYQNFVSEADELTNPSNISVNISDNIFSTDGSTLREALDTGAAAGLQIGENAYKDSSTIKSKGEDLGNAYE